MLTYEPISKKNLQTIIDVQKSLFPKEAGAESIKVALDNDLLKKINPWSDFMTYWLVKKGRAIVGMTGIYTYKKYPDDIFLSWYGVLPEYRGKGYGKSILEWSINEGKRMGFKQFRLSTHSGLYPKAVPLYRKIGMREEKYTHEKKDGVDNLIFSKSLQNKPCPEWNNRMLYLAAYSAAED